MSTDVYELLLAFTLLAVWPAYAQQKATGDVSPGSANKNCHNVSGHLNTEEKAELLRVHNELRSQVTMGRLPGLKTAANMLALRWDDELAELAQAHASRCGSGKEDEYERKSAVFATLGQNVGWEASSGPFTDHLDLPHPGVWSDVHNDVESSIISSYRDTESGIGQFTQMIWANTQKVGCGVATYTRKDNVGRYPYQRSLTCYYGPGGNVPGSPVYEEGAACSRCPPGSTCDKLSGLCHLRDVKVPEDKKAEISEDDWSWRPLLMAIMIVFWLCF